MTASITRGALGSSRRLCTSRRLPWLALAALCVLGWVSLRFQTSAAGAEVVLRLPPVRPDGVAIFEAGIHDEVVGAVAHALVKIGIDPVFYSSFRWGFHDVLSAITHPVVPRLRPAADRTSDDSLWTRLARNEIDVLVLTTCVPNLEWFVDVLADIDTHVVCVVHHGGVAAGRDVRPWVADLARQCRVSLLVLADFVKHTFDVGKPVWATEDAQPAWLDMPVETMVPIFDHPKLDSRPEPAVFPSNVVIQGNLETKRRDYDTVLSELLASVKRDSKLWGYEYSSSLDRYVELADGSPFRLVLAGQPDPEHPLAIPPELADMISVKPGLSYPDFYQLLTDSDLIVPAFATDRPLTEFASSSVAAAIIARTPILASPRLTKTYNYLAHPAIVSRNEDVSEVAAIEALRRSTRHRGHRRARPSEWAVYHAMLDDSNAAIWPRMLRWVRPPQVEVAEG